MQNHEQEFRAFFDAEYRPLRRLAYVLTGNWNEAEDLTQDALLRTYRAWGRIKDRDRPGAYARTILVNRHRSLLRRLRVERKHARDVEALTRAAGEDGVVLWEALLTLPERQRAALALRFYEDLPESEIALILDCPVGTVKSLVHRGLARMREKLGPSYELGEGEAS